MIDIELYKNLLKFQDFGELVYFDELDSTNSTALELSKNNLKNGIVVFAQHQKAGRGRQNNKWFSAPNNSLTFSIILYPNCSIHNINQYSIIAGIAVLDALIELDLNPKLKWPNDILINNKKVCGILCESKLQGQNVKTLVIGFGVNLNTDKNEFPSSLNQSSTSIKIEGGRTYKLEIVLASIINNLKKRIDVLDHFDLHIEDWLANCSHLNKKISFHIDNKIIIGFFIGLTNSGQAIIKVNGQNKFFNGGVITY